MPCSSRSHSLYDYKSCDYCLPTGKKKLEEQTTLELELPGKEIGLWTGRLRDKSPGLQEA